uniref:Uncharacterized protein n=1 Tax=Setaria italica TaxID=4555 RepID=K3ZKV5_SETIT
MLTVAMELVIQHYRRLTILTRSIFLYCCGLGTPRLHNSGLQCVFQSPLDSIIEHNPKVVKCCY